MSYTKEQIKALADQLTCHPVSRSIDEIEMAGEMLINLLNQRDELLPALEKVVDLQQRTLGYATQLHCGMVDLVFDLKATIANVNGGAS